MHIDCHNVKILQHWRANGGRLLSSSVLVEFTLHDHGLQKQPLHSRLVEHVCMTIDPGDLAATYTTKLERLACEQVKRYFDGDDQRENLFADDYDSASHNDADHILSPTEEAELQAELRLIEQDAERIGKPAPETVHQSMIRQPARV